MADVNLTASATARDIEAMKAELKTPQFKAYRRVVNAGDKSQIDAPGTFFYIKEATDAILYQMDNGEELPWDVGTGPDSKELGMFQRLTCINPWSHDVTIVVYVGIGGVVDNRFTLVPSRDFAIPVRDATTEFVARPGSTLAANSVIVFPGTPVLPQIQRKQIVISNLDLANVLYVLDAADEVCAVVFPQTSITLPVSGGVKVKNATSSAIVCYISELWYYKQ